MKKLIALFLVLVLAVMSALTFGGCGSNYDDFLKDNGKLKIVASIFPYYDFVRNIVGEKADVKLLLSPGSEPHDYEPSPSDIVAIENCDIFIYNGGESDEWVDSVLESLQNKKAKLMRMMDYIHPLYERNPDHSQGDEYDEHIWTSVNNAKEFSSAIANEAVKADSANSDYYLSNLSEYSAKLENLNQSFANAVEDGKRKEIVFGDRFPFLYFVTDYGLDYECAFPGCSSETEPSISVVTHLIDYVRDEKLPVVFYLDFSNGKTAKLICEDSGAKPLLFSSCHNVTKKQFESGESYISLMEQNLEVLKEALL